VLIVLNDNVYGLNSLKIYFIYLLYYKFIKHQKKIKSKNK